METYFLAATVGSIDQVSGFVVHFEDEQPGDAGAELTNDSARLLSVELTFPQMKKKREEKEKMVFSC